MDDGRPRARLRALQRFCRAIGSASSSGNGPRAMILREVFAVDEFHDQGSEVTDFFEAMQLRDVGMVEGRERSGLARKSRRAIGIARGRLQEESSARHRDRGGCLGRIHLPCRPRRARQDFVSAENRAWLHQLSLSRSAPRVAA
jgi:hypothetical protein